jgi:hypothetical protein
MKVCHYEELCYRLILIYPMGDMAVDQAIVGVTKHHSIIDKVTKEGILQVSSHNEGRDINTRFTGV